VHFLYSGEVRGRVSSNCKRQAAANFITASSLQSPALLQVNRLARHSSGTSDVSLFEGKTEKAWGARKPVGDVASIGNEGGRRNYCRCV
jgi:hypothetical protein